MVLKTAINLVWSETVRPSAECSCNLHPENKRLTVKNIVEIKMSSAISEHPPLHGMSRIWVG